MPLAGCEMISKRPYYLNLYNVSVFAYAISYQYVASEIFSS